MKLSQYFIFSFLGELVYFFTFSSTLPLFFFERSAVEILFIFVWQKFGTNETHRAIPTKRTTILSSLKTSRTASLCCGFEIVFTAKRHKTRLAKRKFHFFNFLITITKMGQHTHPPPNADKYEMPYKKNNKKTQKLISFRRVNSFYTLPGLQFFMVYCFNQKKKLMKKNENRRSFYCSQQEQISSISFLTEDPNCVLSVTIFHLSPFYLSFSLSHVYTRLLVSVSLSLPHLVFFSGTFFMYFRHFASISLASNF